jgi:phosphate transport system substrate-binding protein
MRMNHKSAKTITKTFICFLALIAISCAPEEPRETPTEEKLTMITSEDVFPVIDLEVQDFSRIYTKTKVANHSSTARDAIVQLLNDSVKLIVIPREFNKEEKNVVEKNQLEVHSSKIAYDGVAVLTNSANAISKISVEQLHAILTGNVQRWSGIKGSGISNAIVVGIGDPNSGVYEYIKNRLLPNEKFTSVVNYCKTSADIVAFVKEHPNAIGFVAISWLEGKPNNVNVLEVGDPNFKQDSTSRELEYFAPLQAHIYRDFYPLSRSIYVYTHNVGKGVAIGLSSFMVGNQGQKIIVKNGLVPATVPVRLVQLNNQ